MERDLIDVGRWVLGPSAIPIYDAASVSLVRERVREMAAAIGLPEVPAASLVNAASELAHNQLAHAVRGFAEVREVTRGEERGLEVVAADDGRGIADVARALAGRPRATGSLGVGFAGALELSHEMDIDVRIGEGTCVHARVFAETDVRRRRVGIHGRPHPEEGTSGDDAGFARTAQGLLVFVADGLGHGIAARQAARCARDVLLENPDLALDRLLARCNTELARTRGAVVAVARVHEARGVAEVASVGNVMTQIVGPGGVRKFGGSSDFLGASRGGRAIRVEEQGLGPRDALVLFSDGVSSRADLESDPQIFHEHPVVAAQRIAERFGAAHDDVTVLVAV